MPDVKDLEQAAQSAAAAPESAAAAAQENVNVVEPTTSVNKPVQPTVDTDNQSSAQVEKPLMMLLDASVLMVIVM